MVIPPFNDVFVVPNNTCIGWYISVCNCGRAHGSCIEKDRSTTVFKSIQVLAGAAAPHPTHRSLMLYRESAESLTINLYASLRKCRPSTFCVQPSALYSSLLQRGFDYSFLKLSWCLHTLCENKFEMKLKANSSIQFLMLDSKSLSEKFAN